MVKQANQSIIELNGQRFDSRTGKLIESVSVPIPSNTGLGMEFVKKAPASQRSTKTSTQVHKTTEPSHTLMRNAVKRPSTISDRKTVAMDVVPSEPGKTTAEVFHSVNPFRIKRAETVHQNSLVSRFGGELRQEAVPSTKPQPIVENQTKQIFKTVTKEQTTNQQTPANAILEKGLRSADSHERKLAKKARLHHRVGHKLGLSAKTTSVALGVFSVLAIGGFFAYQNVPNIALRYASAKAGVSASLPSYQPAGFAVNTHVSYSPGEIAVDYKANADNRSYKITQRNTTWNSEALKDHLVSLNGDTPTSFPDSGRTIYLHDGEADWVNNGIWYSISGNSSLNTNQLIKIATSL